MISTLRRAGLARDLHDHALQLGLLLDESREILTAEETAALDALRRVSWTLAESLRCNRALLDVGAILAAAPMGEARALLAALAEAPPCPVSMLGEIDDQHAIVATGPRGG